jgi:hypothetical protein
MQADKQVKPMFQTFVAFEPDGGMSFSPDESALLDELNSNTIEGVVSVAQVGTAASERAVYAKYAGRLALVVMNMVVLIGC